MSTVVFVSQEVPEKKLLSKITYRLHPDFVLKERIMEEIQKHIREQVPSDAILELDIQLTIKTYDTKNT